MKKWLSIVIISAFFLGVSGIYMDAQADGVYDITPPVITSVSISSSSITAPDDVVVTVNASDSESGIDAIHSAKFKDVSSNRYISTTGFYPFTEISSGVYQYTLSIDQYTWSGNYVLYSVDVYDNAGNGGTYYNKDLYEFYAYDNDLWLPDNASDIKISVTNSNPADSTPPVISSVSLSASSVTVPGSVVVTVNASDSESGIDAIHSVKFKDVSSNRYISTTGFYPFTEISSGVYQYTLSIDQYTWSGNYVLYSVDVYDNAGNGGYYYNKDLYNIGDLWLPSNASNVIIKTYNSAHGTPSYPSYPSYPSVPNTPSIPSTSTDIIKPSVPEKSAPTPDVQVSSTAPTLIKSIEDAKDDAIILVDYTSGSTVDSSVFDALKDTDKTIRFTSNGVVWEFNGKDITDNSKAIDLKTSVSMISPKDNIVTSYIPDIPSDANVVLVKFQSNGVLPGKANISIKLDATMSQYLGTDNIYVYYIDEKNGRLEPVGSGLKIGTDSYVDEFSISHCSYYILTKGPIKGVDYASVHRLYNDASGEHLLTTDKNEVNSLLSQGWREEQSPGKSDTTGTPIYRLHNPATGEHLYTQDSNECQTLTSYYGWQYDLNGSPMFYGSRNSNKGIYRIFNNNLNAIASHHYTSDVNEARELTDNSGYIYDNNKAPVFYLK